VRAQATSASAFQTTPVERGELTATVGATGTVRAAQNAVLPWQTTGTVEHVDAGVGDQVHAGEVLAQLAMDSVPQTVIQAQADLVTAKKALQDAMSDTASAQAAIDLQDAKDAYKKAYDYRLSLNGKQWIEEVRIKYVGGQQVPEIKWHRGYVDEQTIQDADNELALKKAELDDAQRTYDRLENGPNPQDIAAAEAKVEAVQATLDLASIISPIDGTVTQAVPLAGDQVAVGDPAFRVDDLSGLLVDVEVSEVDINSVEVGQPATLVLDAVLGKTYHATVEQVSQAGDNTSGAVNFMVTVRMTDADGDVKPGMTAAVNIVVQQVKNQLLIPNRAVRLVDGQRVVYVLKDGQPKQVQITLGASSDTMSALVGGDLQEGDLIVLNPPTNFGGPGGGGGGFGGGGG
ncbi:MAG: efflux RND transporter periplasmic adaptor subunit, partial [Anaerolineales bacterium]